MKKKLNQILAKLEKIEETQQGQLKGGFSSFGLSGGPSAANFIFNKNCGKHCGNNCHANCAGGCGANNSCTG